VAPRPNKPERNGKLAISLPFEEALKAATEVPADRLTKRPKRKSQKKRAKR
jgi:hypothetical protein